MLIVSLPGLPSGVVEKYACPLFSQPLLSYAYPWRIVNVAIA